LLSCISVVWIRRLTISGVFMSELKDCDVSASVAILTKDIDDDIMDKYLKMQETVPHYRKFEKRKKRQ